MAVKIGELLTQANLITKEQLKQALEHQAQDGGRLGYVLVKLGFIADEKITQVLSKQYGIPSVNLPNFEIDPAVIKLIPHQLGIKLQLIPINRSGGTLTVAMVDPTDVSSMDDIKFMTGYNVEPVVASENSIKDAIERYYGTLDIDKEYEKVIDDIVEKSADEVEVLEEEEDINLAELEKSSEDAPVVRLVNLIFSDCLKRDASDIHIEPYEHCIRVRFRIDGILYEIMKPPFKLKNALTSRIKIMSQLDIAEKRLPQDGRIKLKMKTKTGLKEIDVRVSVLPTLYGEKIVMRILDKSRLMLDMTKLGLEPSSFEKFEKCIASPYGMALVTGPTGSGKTNTLYSSINRINTPETNIITAEDPVEFNLEGVNQVQIKENIGLTFAASLRAFLRQDPNIILVGEIRDFETAEIAIKAALTGHLVLSTLHTNDAPSTVNRLMNMGVEPYLVTSSLLMICAQRLIRRICQDCKEEIEVPPQVQKNLGMPEKKVGSLKFYRGRGCSSCNESGYRGRVGLFEVMDISEELKELVLVGASAMELKRKAIEEGMLTLRDSGLEKIKQGITTIEEVLRETMKN